VARRAIWIEFGSRSFLFETDETVVIEEQDAPRASPPGRPAGRKPAADLGSALKRFQLAKDMIVQVGTEFAESIERLPDPTRAKIEFGITLAGKSGVPMLTKASGEASLKVSIEWAKSALDD
jgi:hypothetical protein